MQLFSLIRPIIHLLPPEQAHNLGLFALAHGLLPAAKPFDDPMLHVDVMGLHFSNPVGLAAGFDKNAIAVDGLLAQGFGFVEAGTTTPRPQPGNDRPRIFRLKEDEAVINRLGFNNHGHEIFTRNFCVHGKHNGVVGANIGKNKDSADALHDYAHGIKAVYAMADYITINISSPNTKGLRDLQQQEALDILLKELMKVRNESADISHRKVPLILKVAPDLTKEQKQDVAKLVMAHKLDGMIVSNTTISRPDALRSANKKEEGGLSGKPLSGLSTEALADFYRLTSGTIPLIGVGGIASAEDAYAKIRSGASLVQLYTALVYQGFGVVREIQHGLVELLKRDGFTNITQAIGADID
ncbi:MAG: quinone-dependent dihydroorotate dehydrogenase [Rickettsiales bacterium]